MLNFGWVFEIMILIKLMQYSKVVSKMYRTYQMPEVEQKDDESKLANFAPSDDFHLTLKTSTTSGCFPVQF